MTIVQMSKIVIFSFVGFVEYFTLLFALVK